MKGVPVGGSGSGGEEWQEPGEQTEKGAGLRTHSMITGHNSCQYFNRLFRSHV